MATRAQRARTAGRARPPVCPATPTRTRRALSLASPRARQAEDFICNWLGNQAWTLALEWPGKTAFNEEGMHDWVRHGTPSGQARSSGPFTFLRVYNAGHMVPLDQPEAALDMVNNFIYNGKWY